MENYSKNKTENAFYIYAKSRGWNITKKGWPDFLICDKNWKPIGAIEVKKKKSHKEFIEGRESIATTKRLKFQKRINNYLNEHNIRTLVWIPGIDIDF